ncbi:MAG: DNA-binding protein [Candidatus Woesearchaeota archaeon]
MSDLEEIKKRKLMELQQQEGLQKQAEEQIQAQIEELENLVRQFLTKDALQRYGNLKIAHTEKAIRVLTILGQMIQTGQLKKQLNDTQFKEILKRIEPKKKEFKIKRV